MKIAQANAVAECDRPADPAKLRVNISSRVHRKVAEEFIGNLGSQAGLRTDQ